MKAKPGFNLRDVCGEQIIVAEGKERMKVLHIYGEKFKNSKVLLQKIWLSCFLTSMRLMKKQHYTMLRLLLHNGLKLV